MLPFRSEFDEVVRGDRSIWAKMAACAVVTTVVVLGGLVKMTRDEHLDVKPSTGLVAACVIGSSVAGAGLALALALKDVVRRRVGEGERVNPVLRVFFGAGVWSLIVWFVTILVAVFVVTIALLA